MLRHLLIVTWLLGATLTTSYILKYSPENRNLTCFNFNTSNEILTKNCTYNDVTSLQLSQSNISSILLTDDNIIQINFHPSINDSLTINLTLLPNLRELNVSHNVLSDFPYSLLKDSTWQILDMSSNEITNLMKPLVTNCLRLYLQSNKIHELSDNFFQDCPNLAELDLSNNNLQQIKLKTFGNLKNLSTLNLSKNQIQTVVGQLSLSKLKSLDLSRNVIQTISKTTFSGVPLSLVELNLSHNKLTEISSDVFAKLLSLKSFSLQGNNITKYIKSLRLPYHLTKLDLSNCSIEDLDQCTFKNLNDIQDLNLMNNSLICNCHLYSITNTFGASVHIQTCRNSSKEIPINRLEMKCQFQTCNNWNPNINTDASSNLNVSAVIEKGQVRIKWMTSLVVNSFHVSISDSSQKQIEAVQLKYDHEYTFDTDSVFVTYDVCVDALNDDKDAISKKCIKVFIKDANMITGIVAGVIALIPCIFGLIYITCKDRHYIRVQNSRLPITKSNARQTNTKKVQAKLAPIQESHNNAFQPDDDKLTSPHQQNSEKLPHISVEIPARNNSDQCTNL